MKLDRSIREGNISISGNQPVSFGDLVAWVLPAIAETKVMTGMAEDILNYLMDHPEASDTVDGIARWWILEQRVKREMEEVKATLSDLARRGFVLERKSADTVAHYRLNPAKAVEIAAELGRKIE